MTPDYLAALARIAPDARPTGDAPRRFALIGTYADGIEFAHFCPNLEVAQRARRLFGRGDIYDLHTEEVCI